MRFLTALVVSTLLFACSRDREAQLVFSDMEKLQTDVRAALEQSPDEAGLGVAEAAVAKSAPGLRERMTSLRGAKLSPATHSMSSHHCVQNEAAASNGGAYLRQGLYKSNAPQMERQRLALRMDKLKADMHDICN